MLRYLMTLIISVGRNIKLMMTLNLCLVSLNKIIEINYTYGSLKQPTKNNIVDGNNIYLFIREWVIEMGYS